MSTTPQHLKALEEIEKTSIFGLVEALREEGIDAVRYVLWDATISKILDKSTGIP